MFELIVVCVMDSKNKLYNKTSKLLLWVKLFLLVIKFNNRIDDKARAIKTNCFNKNSTNTPSIITDFRAITKAKIVTTKTIIKFVGLDLLKKLVNINRFCIFAT